MKLLKNRLSLFLVVSPLTVKLYVHVCVRPVHTFLRERERDFFSDCWVFMTKNVAIIFFRIIDFAIADVAAGARAAAVAEVRVKVYCRCVEIGNAIERPFIFYRMHLLPPDNSFPWQ